MQAGCWVTLMKCDSAPLKCQSPFCCVNPNPTHDSAATIYGMGTIIEVVMMDRTSVAWRPPGISPATVAAILSWTSVFVIRTRTALCQQMDKQEQFHSHELWMTGLTLRVMCILSIAYWLMLLLSTRDGDDDDARKWTFDVTWCEVP